VKVVMSSVRLLIVAICIVAIGASPSSQPSSKIVALFTKLADRDPSVRDLARIDLMGLSRAELPELRRYVQQHRPLAPSQAAALREIVTQVCASGETYPSNASHGFLGVSLPSALIPQQEQPMEPGSPPPIGVIIGDRMPGLSSFRMLANSDVIIGITERPEVAIRNVGDLQSIISEFRGGETVHLEIFRSGRTFTLPVTLGARPIEVELNPNGSDFFNREKQRRLDLSEDYWQREFAPLLENGVS
jgi:hypothetical protein